MPILPPEAPAPGIGQADLMQLRDAIATTMKQMSPRDQVVLRAFYVDELPIEEILAITGLTLDNFRVVLCRAKEKFRRVYRGRVKSAGAPEH